jgi:hypothetical protein
LDLKPSRSRASSSRSSGISRVVRIQISVNPMPGRCQARGSDDAPA